MAGGESDVHDQSLPYSLRVVRTYLLVFDSDENAKRFCRRLHLAIDKDVSTFRLHEHVRVFDGTLNGAARRIFELARTSSATSFRAVKG